MTFRITTTETGEHKPQYDGNRLAYLRGGIGSMYPELPTLSGEKALTRILDGPLTYTEGKLTRIDS